MNEKLELSQVLAGYTPEEIAKAGVESMGLHGIRVIKDLWHDYAAIPERNDTKTGPAMHTSGSGAEKGVADYSNPAPQIGITEQYDKFSQQNIEEFGKMSSAMKANTDAVLAGIGALTEAVKALSVKSEEKKEEHKEEEKKEEMKSASAPKIAALWSELGDLESAVAKAENEIQDINGLNSAKEHIESAERYLDQVEQHELSEMVGMKAMVAIQSGWRSLAKATKLNSYDLKGYGNQVDAQVPGDETKDASMDDLKSAEAKAEFYAGRAGRIRKAKGLTPVVTAKKGEDCADGPKMEAKAEDKPEDKKEEHKPEEMKAELANLEKSFNERIKFLTDKIEQTTGTKAPTMTPIFMKSQGITSDSAAKTLNDRIQASIEAGELTEEDGDTCRSITNMYQAVGKGHVSSAIVESRVNAAPLAVQSFFNSMEAQN